MSSLDEQYYISSYTKLSADKVETAVILNDPEKKTIAEIEKLDVILGPMAFSTTLLRDGRGPADIFLLYLKRAKDGWNLQSRDIAGARRDAAKASCDKFALDHYTQSLSLQEGLSVLIAGWEEIIKPSKDSVETMPVGSRFHASINRQMYSAIQALEDCGIKTKLHLDLSERFSIA